LARPEVDIISSSIGVYINFQEVTVATPVEGIDVATEAKTITNVEVKNTEISSRHFVAFTVANGARRAATQ
jgi:hypothetical protein